jgi:hypothetical protein
MKIFFDSNKFINSSSFDENLVDSRFDSEIIDNNDIIFLDLHYDLPLYRYIEDEIVEISDPLEYQLDTTGELWNNYTKKMTDQIKDWILTKTNSELRIIYVNSPYYIQDLMFKNIQYFWSDKIPQWNINLSLEILCRVMIEKLYIENIEERSLTEGEQTAFNSLLSTMHCCNVMLKNNPSSEDPILDSSNWFLTYISQMTATCLALRSNEFQQRMYVCFGIGG